VLPALLAGEDEQDGMKMGEEERDMASAKRASMHLRGLVWRMRAWKNWLIGSPENA